MSFAADAWRSDVRCRCGLPLIRGTYGFTHEDLEKAHGHMAEPNDEYQTAELARVAAIKAHIAAWRDGSTGGAA